MSEWKYRPPSPLWKRLLCGAVGHRSRRDVIMPYTTHYPHPCWCGEYLGEHIPCTCQYPIWPPFTTKEGMTNG